MLVLFFFSDAPKNSTIQRPRLGCSCQGRIRGVQKQGVIKDRSSFVMLPGLLMVTCVLVYITQVVEGICDVNMLLSKLVQ